MTGPPWGVRGGAMAGIDEAARTGHPAVDAAVQAIANAAVLAPADQLPEYEAAYQTLRDTLATIDQA